MRCSVYIVCPSVLGYSIPKLHQTLEAKKIFKRNKIMLQSTFNPGLMLSSFRTTWPWLKISVIERTLVIVLSHINLVLVLVNKLIITLSTHDSAVKQESWNTRAKMMDLNKRTRPPTGTRDPTPNDKEKFQRYFTHNYVVANSFISCTDVAKVTRRSSGLSWTYGRCALSAMATVMGPYQTSSPSPV